MMQSAERLNSGLDQLEKVPDNIWIIENANALFDFASTKFRIHGAGVVHIDRRNLLKPPRYITTTEIKKYKLKFNLRKFVEQYDPNNSFVLLLESKITEHPYRVNIIKTKST